MSAINETGPAQVFCLGECLHDEMVERGWNTDDVAERMMTRHGPVRDALVVALILSVHKDSLLIDDDTFDGLARAFNVSPEFFRNIDATWRKYPDRRADFTPSDAVFGPIVANGLAAGEARP